MNEKCPFKRGNIISGFEILVISHKKPKHSQIQRCKTFKQRVCEVEQTASLPKHENKDNLVINKKVCFFCKQGVFARLEHKRA